MSSTVYTAAIDLGATSGRVILGQWARNRLTLREVHRFPNSFRTLGGHDYWDLGTLWHETQTGLRQAAAALPRGAKLASVGVDTWGVDYVLVNDAGRLVSATPAPRSPASTPRPASRMFSTTPRCNSRRSSPPAPRSRISPPAACFCPTISTSCSLAGWPTS
jgi:sugar (pentulose or hexulose) kinase